MPTVLSVVCSRAYSPWGPFSRRSLETNRARPTSCSKASAVSRPFAVASAVPKERVDALRRAFEAAMKDPEFIAEAERLDLEIGLTNGEDLQKIVADIISASPPLLERMRTLMVVHAAEAVKGDFSGKSSD